MKILNLEDVNLIPDDAKFIEFIDLGSQFFISKIDSTTLTSDEIVGTVNRINSQGITSFDLGALIYTRHNIRLGFPHLSTAEKLFFAAMLVDNTKDSVYFCREFRQLRDVTKELFISLFYKSEYVNLVTTGYTDVYKGILNKYLGK